MPKTFGNPPELPSLPRRRAVARIAGAAGLIAAGLSTACNRDPERPWKGSVFPTFALPTLDGAIHDANEYFGAPLLINFWATWCPPCRSEMADLDALYRTLAPRRLKLLAISVDTDRNAVIEYQNRMNFSFTMLLDAGQQWSATALRVPGFPTSYLVGRDGRIREAWLGPRAWTQPALQAKLAALLELE